MAGLLTDDDVALLEQPVIANLATVMADGSPQVTPVWVDTDGETVLLNTAKGRVKYDNIAREPRVAVSVVDPQNPFRVVAVRGEAQLIEEGADDHIDRLSQKYLGEERYPFRQPGEERVTVRVVPTSRMPRLG